MPDACDLTPDEWWCTTCYANNRQVFTYLENGVWHCACDNPPLSVVQGPAAWTKPPVPSAWTNNPFRG